VNWFYKNREERSKWLAERFANEISKSRNLLDVGCYNADFKKHIPKTIKYTGIDISGKPDIFINLDKIEKLPFKNNEFDTTICADVLEHLENIHLIFDELCRVSNKYIIITLPNAYASIPEFIKGKKYAKNTEKRKQFGKYNKFYGLPLEIPEDRHRWFFSYDEAVEFLKFRAKIFNFEINVAESEYMYKKRPLLRKVFFTSLKKINRNLVYRNIIVLLEKTNGKN